MRKLFFVLLSILLIEQASIAQLSGTKNIPGDYPDLATAITALNTLGVGAGGVTLNLVAANPQTAPAGGYIIGNTGSAVLSTASSSQQVTLQGNSNIITAFSPQATGATNDAVFKIIGADWITIRNFTIQENAANTTATIAGNNMTEWGIGLFYTTVTDGAQNNSILNNTVTLNRSYQNSIGVYSSVRHNPATPGTIADISSPAGSNSSNRIQGNTISNVSEAIALVGSLIPANMDNINAIGDNPAAAGNTISNWGHDAGPASFVDIDNNSIAGILVINQRSIDIMSNSVTGGSFNTANKVYGILSRYTANAPTSPSVPEIWFNTVSLSQAGNGDLVGMATLSAFNVTAYGNYWLTSNNIINCAITGASSSANMIGVMNNCNTTQFLSIYDNLMRNNTSSATTGGFTGLYNTGNGPLLMNLGGFFGDATGGAVSFSNATTAPIYGIRNDAPGTDQLLFNPSRFQGFSLVSSGPFTAISNTTPITGTNSAFNTNQFGSATVPMASFSGTQTAPVTYIINTTGAANTKLSVSNNSFFLGVDFMVPASSPVSFIRNTAALFSSVDINNNSLNKITLNTSGDVKFISSASNTSTLGTKIQNFNTNAVVTGFTKSQPGGNVTFIEALGTDDGSPTINIKDNNFSNLAITGASFTGINNQNGLNATTGPHKLIQNNMITGTVTATGTVTGISADKGSDITIATNTITGLSSSGGSVKGISISNNTAISRVRNNIIGELSVTAGDLTGILNTTSGSTVEISKNKIYFLAGNHASATVNGITVHSGNIISIDNNLVGDLSAVLSSGTNPLNGLNILGGTTVNVYYNTIWISSPSVAALFGSSAINASAGTQLTLRNNILVNSSASNGSGLTVAYRRSAASLTNYNSSSNNNLFYAGTPGPSHLIFYDGVNADQTLGVYQTRVSPRDAVSITEDPNFISVAGSNPNFLHINLNIATPIDGGAAPIAGYTTDYDGGARNAIAPDIGADEFTFVAGCPQPTAVSVTLVTATTARVNFTSTGFNFIVEYGPAGFTPGTGSSAGAGGTIVTATSSPVNLTGLNSSTAYQVYVRQVCSTPPYSTNSTVVSFSTIHLFDEANTAGLLIVGAGCTGAPYNTAGATASSLEKYPSCSGTRLAPIWFKFAAPSSGAVRVTTDMGTPTLSNSKIALFAASDVNNYNTFSILSCDDDGGSVMGSGSMSVLYATSLAPGTTYYIAVDKYDNSIADGTFCIAVDELDNSMLSTNTACANSYQVPTANSNTTYTGWVPLLDGNSKLIAMVTKGTGGAVNAYTSAAQNINTGAVRSSGSTEYLDRNYLINSTATNVLVKFFFLTSELNSLMAADPTVTFGNLGASRQGGTICEANFSPLTGPTSFLPQLGNGISADGLVRWIDVSTPGFSNFFLQGALGGPLPISLIAFSGQKNGSANVLHWTTGTEINNRGFEIQRSTDGINYTAIGFVNTQAPGGNSTSILNYVFTDHTPPGIKQYYRLRQTDIDNRSKLSSIVMIKGEKPLSLAIAALYPSPANTQLNIVLETPVRGNITLRVMDATGKILLQEKINAEAGSNASTLDISRLAGGTYFVKAVTELTYETATGKFVKQ